MTAIIRRFPETNIRRTECAAKEKQWFMFPELKSNLFKPELHLVAIFSNKQSRR
jgi:hypothetical protein